MIEQPTYLDTALVVVPTAIIILIVWFFIFRPLRRAFEGGEKDD